MWQKLFAEEKNKKLSDAEVKGLLGELCALRNVILMRYSPQTAVAGWIGPIGADRDFEFSDTWYEAKAVTLSKDKCQKVHVDTSHIGSCNQYQRSSPTSNLSRQFRVLRLKRQTVSAGG